jgi:hypothetical protein
VPFDPTTLSECRVVFSSKSGLTILEKNIEDLKLESSETGGMISFTMTQEETLLFGNDTECRTQLHVMDSEGVVSVSNVITFNTSTLLKREALGNES